jgi:hypothetical protein
MSDAAGDVVATISEDDPCWYRRRVRTDRWTGCGGVRLMLYHLLFEFAYPSMPQLSVLT